MKRTFKLTGLDCANCAAKMENAIAKLPGVNSVSVNFMTTKMTLETDEGSMNAVLEAAKDIIKKLEPDVVVSRA